MEIIRLNALADWRQLPKGQALVFDTGPETIRAVRLLLNLETVTTLYLEEQDATIDPRLLVTAGPGLVRVEFDAVGVFGLFADEQAGEVQFQCTEFEAAHIEPVDEGSFTEIVQRRSVDPDFEEMWYRANANLEKRLAAQNELHQRQLAALLSQVNSNDATDDEATPPATPPAAKPDEGGVGATAPTAGSEADGQQPA